MEQIDVILVRKVKKLGNIGDIVGVKPGYARNFLFPQGIALRATKKNQSYFESQRHEIESENDRVKASAMEIASKLNGTEITVIRQASERGNLYGSVTSRDIANCLKTKGFSVESKNIELKFLIKEIGVYDIEIYLHPEVCSVVKLSVAQSQDEAEAQLKIN